MRLHRTFPAAIAIGALLTVAGCSTNRQGDDPSPSYLTVDFTLLPLAQNVNCGCFLQFQTVTLHNNLKNPDAGTSNFLDVRLDYYQVDWTRLDGGKTASPSERFGGNLIVPAGSVSTLTNYEFMGPDALLRAPLDQLFPFNGGIDRDTGLMTIRQAGHVTFVGHNMAGQLVTGDGVFGMNFYYAATARAGALSVPSALAPVGLKPLAGRR